MKKILVSGLDDPPDGKYRKIIQDAFPTYVVFFMKTRDGLELLHHVDLVLVCHPMLLKLLYGEEDLKKRWQRDVKGFWHTLDHDCWFFSTTKQTLKEDIYFLMEHFPSDRTSRPRKSI